jgi:flagellar hook-basal body complex protein FliE
MNPVSASSAVSRIGNQPLGHRTNSQQATGNQGFGKLVEGLVQQTNQAQLSSDKAIQQLVTGKTDNVQQVVMAVANAEMSFQLFMEIRNKLIDSYNELMRMQF